MAAFMDDSSVVARKGYSHIREPLQSHFNTITFSQDHFPHLQFPGHQICNSILEQHWLINNRDVYPAIKAIDNSVSKGGDQPMP